MKIEKDIFKIKAYEIIATITIFLATFKVLDMFSLTWIDVFLPFFVYVLFILFSAIYLVIFWR